MQIFPPETYQFAPLIPALLYSLLTPITTTHVLLLCLQLMLLRSGIIY